MLKFLLKKNVIAISLFLVTINCFAVDKIQYKQTAFGISEKEFLAKFKNDNFKCVTTKDGQSRSCESTIATYSNQKTARTWANFYQNLLYGVTIHFEYENQRDGEFNKKIILDSLKNKFGKPLDTKNSTEKINGISLKNEEYTWANVDDASLVCTITDADGFTFVAVGMRSVSIFEKVKNENKKSKLTDM